ncbi:hypothetical protein D5R81_01295 [Parashewanella spongiae]|uniref:DUF3887 domain-containing protein n=1 Tax=Parashewanella spongiae TaxID=342950 RepID=A0A3A6TT34_9GAMM|nr:hypothetical protein [Parashewanella spongiae]MCL1078936.1 hypothetical protein [Parashewanella spongiae]RJY19369.1 hypothetical protein D5R81_01295 [Parashewanella spongiae]
MHKLIISVLISLSFSVNSAETDSILLKAAQQYKSSGAEKFILTLLEKSSFNDSTDVKQNVDALHSIENVFGKFEGVEKIKEVTLNKRSRIEYFTLDYQKAAAFGHIIYYTDKKGVEVTSQMQFDLDPWQVLPQNLLSE